MTFHLYSALEWLIQYMWGLDGAIAPATVVNLKN